MKPDQLEEFVPDSLRLPPPRIVRQQNHSPGLGERALDLAAAFFYAFMFIVAGMLIATQAGQGVFVFWAGCVLVGAVVGEMKGNIKAGALWTGFLGPLGLIIVLMMPNKYKVAAAAAQAAQQARLVQLQEAQLKELQELREKLGVEAPRS